MSTSAQSRECRHCDASRLRLRREPFTTVHSHEAHPDPLGNVNNSAKVRVMLKHFPFPLTRDGNEQTGFLTVRACIPYSLLEPLRDSL
jgi:hypothetical protein